MKRQNLKEKLLLLFFNFNVNGYDAAKKNRHPCTQIATSSRTKCMSFYMLAFWIEVFWLNPLLAKQNQKFYS